MVTKLETSEGKSLKQTSLQRYQSLRKHDEKLVDKYKGPVLGIDEVGMAPLAGPVLAGALILKSFDGLEGVDDCKVLSPQQRLAMYEKILPNVLEFHFATVPPDEIDLINIYEAGVIARTRAYQAMRAKKIGVVLVDGNDQRGLEGASTAYGGVTILSVVKGDSKSLTVAAASVLAKVTRDNMMLELHKTYPYYSWDTNKGYGSRAHLQAIKNYGITPYHRRSFRPVKEAHRWRQARKQLRRGPRIDRGGQDGG